MVLITLRSCVQDSYGPDFTFYFDNFVFLNNLHTFIALSKGELAQLVEHGASKGKVMCSMLKESKSQRVKESNFPIFNILNIFNILEIQTLIT